MALFTPDDPSYDESRRMTGFNRYKQLMSFHSGSWLKLNLITTAAAVPFILGATAAIMYSSSLMMLGSGLIGGLILGPFLAGLFDSIMRGLMGDPGNWWKNYRKSLKQNLVSGLIAGAIDGVIFGMYLFMAYMLLNSAVKASAGTIAVYLFAGFLIVMINILYWPQMVLFKQTFLNRMRNIILFTSKYFWKVLRSCLLLTVWLLILVMFAPITFLVIPFIGFWYILFVTELLIYEPLNYELHIEELYGLKRDYGEDDSDDAEAL